MTRLILTLRPLLGRILLREIQLGIVRPSPHDCECEWIFLIVESFQFAIDEGWIVDVYEVWFSPITGLFSFHCRGAHLLVAPLEFSLSACLRISAASSKHS